MFQMKYRQVAVLAILGCLFCISCHNFYKATKAPADTTSQKAAVIDSLKVQDRYFVLRSGSQAYAMTNVSLSSDQQTLHANLEQLPENHQFHLVNGRRGQKQFKKSDPQDLMVLNEVHFYIQPDSAITTGKYVLDLNKVQKLEIIEKDKKRTSNSYVIGAIGYTIGAFVLVSIIVAALKSSCPFVSAYDGNNFSLQGEIYGGAIYPQLARHDFMPLKMQPLPGGTLQLKISNELKERQYTDMAELWVVTHPKEEKVLSDEKGNLYTVSNPQTPAALSLNGQTKSIASLKKAGDNNFLYMDDTMNLNASNDVIVKFSNPAKSQKAKLILSLKNSYFLDLLYGELAKGFGNYYSSYAKQQEKKSAAELLQWVKEQNIPMEVSIKTTNGYEKIADLTTIGPLATREIVVPINLPVNSESFIDIKLSSGFLFWEIDYAAIDFSEQNNFTLQKLAPIKATDETGKNVLSFLQKEDASYLSQPAIGNSATIIYKTDELKDESKIRTYILHSKGYYEHIRNFTGKPNVAFLNQFKKPGAFPLYGLGLYKKLNKETLATMALKN
jgi:hypothetical protein